MKVDNKLIDDLSRLAKLNFDEQTIEEMKSDFKNILNTFLKKRRNVNVLPLW